MLAWAGKLKLSSVFRLSSAASSLPCTYCWMTVCSLTRTFSCLMVQASSFPKARRDILAGHSVVLRRLGPVGLSVKVHRQHPVRSLQFRRRKAEASPSPTFLPFARYHLDICNPLQLTAHNTSIVHHAAHSDPQRRRRDPSRQTRPVSSPAVQRDVGQSAAAFACIASSGWFWRLESCIHDLFTDMNIATLAAGVTLVSRLSN